MFKNKNLSVIAYANGFTLYHYKSDESLGVITQDNYLDNYFDPIIHLSATGDIIIINASDGTAIKVFEIVDNHIILKGLSK